MADLRKLLTTAEENLPALIRRLKGQAPEVEAALAKKAPAIEGEVVGDLATQAAPKVLPDIEGQLVDKGPLMLENVPTDTTSNIADEVTKQLTPKQKIAAGLTAAAGAGTLYRMNEQESGGNQPPKPPKDTTNFIAGPESDETSEGSTDEEDETPVNKTDEQKALDSEGALSKLALTKQDTGTAQPPMAQDAIPNIPAPDIADQTAKQLELARQADADRNLTMGLLKAAQMGGAALAGTKADTSYADTELADRNREATRLKTNMDVLEEARNIQDKQQKRDPNSKVSQIYQSMLQQLKPDMNVSGLSAEQVEKVFPQIGTIVDKQLQIQMMKEHYSQASLDRQAAIEARKQQVMDKADEKDKAAIAKVFKDADAERARINTPMGREEAKLNAGEHAKQLLEDYKGREDQMKPYELHALAMDYATLQSPGIPTEHTIKEMGIDTFQGDAGKILSKITGKVYGAGAKGYADSVRANIQSQMNKSSMILQTEMNKIIKDNEQLFTNPKSVELLRKNLSERYLPSEKMQSSSLYGTQTVPKSTTINSGQTQQQDPKIVQYAAQYGLDYAHAKNILKSRGYNEQL